MYFHDYLWEDQRERQRRWEQRQKEKIEFWGGRMDESYTTFSTKEVGDYNHQCAEFENHGEQTNQNNILLDILAKLDTDLVEVVEGHKAILARLDRLEAHQQEQSSQLMKIAFLKAMDDQGFMEDEGENEVCSSFIFHSLNHDASSIFECAEQDECEQEDMSSMLKTTIILNEEAQENPTITHTHCDNNTVSPEPTNTDQSGTIKRNYYHERSIEEIEALTYSDIDGNISNPKVFNSMNNQVCDDIGLNKSCSDYLMTEFDSFIMSCDDYSFSTTNDIFENDEFVEKELDALLAEEGCKAGKNEMIVGLAPKVDPPPPKPPDIDEKLLRFFLGDLEEKIPPLTQVMNKGKTGNALKKPPSIFGRDIWYPWKRRRKRRRGNLVKLICKGKPSYYFHGRSLPRLGEVVILEMDRIYKEVYKDKSNTMNALL